jgi:DNA-binding PadR family transcriptional regulator
VIDGTPTTITRITPRQPTTSLPSDRVRPDTATQTSATIGTFLKPSGGAQRILNTLAWLQSVGIREAARTQVATMADLAPRAGTFGTYLSRLKSAGLINYTGPKGWVSLTDAGRREADPQSAPQTTEELHRQVFAKLGGGMERILRELIAVYPQDLDKWELAKRTTLTANAGTFGTYLSRLRSLGFIDVERTTVRANPVLFIGS